jgi:hypothetical protein
LCLAPLKNSPTAQALVAEVAATPNSSFKWLPTFEHCC